MINRHFDLYEVASESGSEAASYPSEKLELRADAFGRRKRGDGANTTGRRPTAYDIGNGRLCDRQIRLLNNLQDGVRGNEEGIISVLSVDPVRDGQCGK